MFLGLDVIVGALNMETASKEQVLERLRESDLILGLTGPDGEAGLVWIDAALLSSIIEAQTVGRVGPNVLERKPTKIDAVMTSDLIDLWLEGLVAHAEEAGATDAMPVAGYSRQNAVLDARAAEIALERGELTVASFSLDIADGAKSGVFSFAVPHVQTLEEKRDGETRVWDRVRATEARLRAVLPRITRAARDVAALKVGDEIRIPLESLGNVRLVTSSGRIVSRARLGQISGRRALRLIPSGEETSPGPPDFDQIVAAEPELIEQGSDDSADAAMAVPKVPEADDPDLPELPELPDMPEEDGS